MRYAILAANIALLACLPSLALAQSDKKQPAPPATCEALVDTLDIVESTDATTIADTETGCRVTNFYVGFGSFNRYRIDELVLNSPNLFGDHAAQFFPGELDLTLNGFSVAPDTGSPLNNYIIEVQSSPMDVHLAYRWDRDARTIDVSDLSITAQDRGSIRLATRLSAIDIDPQDLDRPSRIPGALESFSLAFDDARFFSVMAAPGILSMLPYDEDPRQAIATYQQASIAFINGLPEQTISADSKAALETFITSFPRVTGDYRLELRADPPLEFSSLAIEGILGLLPKLSQLQLAVTHSPVHQP